MSEVTNESNESGESNLADIIAKMRAKAEESALRKERERIAAERDRQELAELAAPLTKQRDALYARKTELEAELKTVVDSITEVGGALHALGLSSRPMGVQTEAKAKGSRNHGLKEFAFPLFDQGYSVEEVIQSAREHFGNQTSDGTIRTQTYPAWKAARAI